jgi:aminopeptidase N
VLLNPGDVAYGRFLPDRQTQELLLERFALLKDPLQRAVGLSALFDAVREAEVAPQRYSALAASLVAQERDAPTHAWLLDTLTTTVLRYLEPAAAKRTAADLAGQWLSQLREGLDAGRALQTFRSLVRLSAADEVLDLCEALLEDGQPVPGLALGQADRYLALAALLAAGRGEAWCARMTGSRTPAGAEEYAYAALAARADRATKERYFASYLQPRQPPEQWVQASLANFHWPGQSALTLSYLAAALEQLDWVKRERRIFFMPAWIDAFVNGHSDRAALDIVESFLGRDELAEDVRRKLLESLDGLRRAVRIRAKWSGD